jgi:hypothetical protein
MDTGSSDLWVKSTEIVSSGKSNGDPSFDAGKSSTYKLIDGASWDITYGDQSGASGIVGTDHVQIGDITVENQAVELATSISDQFSTMAGSGLCGLSWGTINTVQPQKVKTIVENMIEQGDISEDQSLFTAYLGYVSQSSALVPHHRVHDHRHSDCLPLFHALSLLSIAETDSGAARSRTRMTPTEASPSTPSAASTKTLFRLLVKRSTTLLSTIPTASGRSTPRPLTSMARRSTSLVAKPCRILVLRCG